MRKSLLRKVAGVLAGLAVPVLALAARDPGRSYFDVSGGETFFAAGSGLAGGHPTVGLGVGHRFGHHFGVEAQIASAFSSLQTPGGRPANQYSGSVVGRLYASGRSSPYLSLGVGAASNLFSPQVGRGSSLMGILGVGYEQRLGRHFGLHLGVRDQMLFHPPLSGPGTLNDIQVTGGISYFWGSGDRHGFPVVGPSRS